MAKVTPAIAVSIPSSKTVTIVPPAKSPVYDRWWAQMILINGSDVNNVVAVVTLRRARLDDKNVIQWITDQEAVSAGVTAAVTYSVEHVLERAAGTYVPPPDQKVDPLMTPEIAGLLANLTEGLLGGVTQIGGVLGLI